MLMSYFLQFIVFPIIALLVLSAALGNGLLFFIIIYGSSHRRSGELYIASLSTADFLMCVVVFPVSMIHELGQPGRHEKMLCGMWLFLDTTLCAVMIYTILLIYVDVAFQTKKFSVPLPGISRSRILTSICCTWIVGLMIGSVPFVLGQLNVGLLPRAYNATSECLFGENTYTAGILSALIILPTLWCTYMFIDMTLLAKSCGKSRMSQTSELMKTELAENLHKNSLLCVDVMRSNTLTLGIKLFLFCVSWVPLLVMIVIYSVCEGGCTDHLIRSCAAWLPFVNSWINPLIYCMLNKRISDNLKRLCSCCNPMWKQHGILAKHYDICKDILNQCETSTSDNEANSSAFSHPHNSLSEGNPMKQPVQMVEQTLHCHPTDREKGTVLPTDHEERIIPKLPVLSNLSPVFTSRLSVNTKATTGTGLITTRSTSTVDFKAAPTSSEDDVPEKGDDSDSDSNREQMENEVDHTQALKRSLLISSAATSTNAQTEEVVKLEEHSDHKSQDDKQLTQSRPTRCRQSLDSENVRFIQSARSGEIYGLPRRSRSGHLSNISVHVKECVSDIELRQIKLKTSKRNLSQEPQRKRTGNKSFCSLDSTSGPDISQQKCSYFSQYLDDSKESCVQDQRLSRPQTYQQTHFSSKENVNDAGDVLAWGCKSMNDSDFIHNENGCQKFPSNTQTEGVTMSQEKNNVNHDTDFSSDQRCANIFKTLLMPGETLIATLSDEQKQHGFLREPSRVSEPASTHVLTKPSSLTSNQGPSSLTKKSFGLTETNKANSNFARTFMESGLRPEDMHGMTDMLSVITQWVFTSGQKDPRQCMEGKERDIERSNDQRHQLLDIQSSQGMEDVTKSGGTHQDSALEQNPFIVKDDKLRNQDTSTTSETSFHDYESLKRTSTTSRETMSDIKTDTPTVAGSYETRSVQSIISSFNERQKSESDSSSRRSGPEYDNCSRRQTDYRSVRQVNVPKERAAIKEQFEVTDDLQDLNSTGAETSEHSRPKRKKNIANQTAMSCTGNRLQRPCSPKPHITEHVESPVSSNSVSKLLQLFQEISLESSSDTKQGTGKPPRSRAITKRKRKRKKKRTDTRNIQEKAEEISSNESLTKLALEVFRKEQDSHRECSIKDEEEEKKHQQFSDPILRPTSPCVMKLTRQNLAALALDFNEYSGVCRTLSTVVTPSSNTSISDDDSSFEENKHTILEPGRNTGGEVSRLPVSTHSSQRAIVSKTPYASYVRRSETSENKRIDDDNFPLLYSSSKTGVSMASICRSTSQKMSPRSETSNTLKALNTASSRNSSKTPQSSVSDVQKNQQKHEFVKTFTATGNNNHKRNETPSVHTSRINKSHQRQDPALKRSNDNKGHKGHELKETSFGTRKVNSKKDKHSPVRATARRGSPTTESSRKYGQSMATVTSSTDIPDLPKTILEADNSKQSSPLSYNSDDADLIVQVGSETEEKIHDALSYDDLRNVKPQDSFIGCGDTAQVMDKYGQSDYSSDDPSNSIFIQQSNSDVSNYDDDEGESFWGMQTQKPQRKPRRASQDSRRKRTDCKTATTSGLIAWDSDSNFSFSTLSSLFESNPTGILAKILTNGNQNDSDSSRASFVPRINSSNVQTCFTFPRERFPVAETQKDIIQTTTKARSEENAAKKYRTRNMQYSGRKTKS